MYLNKGIKFHNRRTLTSKDEYLSILPYANDKNIEKKIDKFLIGTCLFKIAKNDGDILILEANNSYFNGLAFLARIEL